MLMSITFLSIFQHVQRYFFEHYIWCVGQLLNTGCAAGSLLMPSDEIKQTF